jgi:UDP-GlcNAc:undecaprenyl-phosphate/decaprenyl-phosphate GlcNAc-1-phosphate transferase
MQISLTQYLALFSSSMLAVGLLTPLMRLIAIRLNVVDNPDQGHKTHRTPIPYLGGLAIIIGVLAVTLFSLTGYSMSKANIVLALSLLLPAIALGLIGLVDDIRNLSPWPRFVAQSVVGLITAVLLISTDTVGSPTGSVLVDALITIIWIVGITNSVNFFDNLDGGASGTVAITSIALLILALQGEQYLIAALAAVLAGATSGFLLWNKPPARIYMGDAGALFLGLLIASLVVRLDTNPINSFATFSIPILLLAVPIMDTSVAVLSRLQRGISPFQGGKDHLSHRLMRSGLSKRLSVISLWIMTAYFAAIAIVISHAPFKFEGLVSAIGAISWLISFALFVRLKSE